MKRVTVFRHLEFEDLGVFEQVLQARGCQIVYVDTPVEPPVAESSDLLVVLGGPVGAYETDTYPFLGEELAVIQARLAGGAPTLGVCLGAQLIARALGARVYPSGAREIGWSPLNLSDAGRSGALRALDGVPVLHWHGDTFDLPRGAIHLAATPPCANQAFSINRHVLALQFHPEVKAESFERWLVGHAVEIASTPGLSVQGLRAQARVHAAATTQACRRLLTDWLDALA